MTKIYLGKSFVKTSGTPPNQKSKPWRCYRIHREQYTNPFFTVFSRHREGVSEGNRNKSFFSRKERRHSIQKSSTIMAIKTVMDMDMVNINQETLFNKVQFPFVVPVEDLKHIHPYIKSLHKKLIILCKKNSKCTVSRKVEKLYRELENSDKQHRNSAVSRGLYDTIS